MRSTPTTHVNSQLRDDFAMLVTTHAICESEELTLIANLRGRFGKEMAERVFIAFAMKAWVGVLGELKVEQRVDCGAPGEVTGGRNQVTPSRSCRNGEKSRSEFPEQFRERDLHAERDDLEHGEGDGLSSALDVADEAAINAELSRHTKLGEISLATQFAKAKAEAATDIMSCFGRWRGKGAIVDGDV